MVPWADLADLGRDLWDGGRFWEIWLDHPLSYDLSWIVMNFNWFLEQVCLRSKLHLRAYWGSDPCVRISDHMFVCWNILSLMILIIRNCWLSTLVLVRQAVCDLIMGKDGRPDPWMMDQGVWSDWSKDAPVVRATLIRFSGTWFHDWLGSMKTHQFWVMWGGWLIDSGSDGHC